MGIFDIFVKKSEQNGSFEPNYDKLSPSDVELEFKIRKRGFETHTGARLAEDINIMSLLATRYKHIPSLHFCIDKFPALGRDISEFERLGCELGDAVCAYRYYSLDRIRDYPPERAEECVGKAVKAGAPAAYLTLGDYYIERGDTSRAIEIYKLAASLNVKEAEERIRDIDFELYLELSARRESEASKAPLGGGLSARLRREREEK